MVYLLMLKCCVDKGNDSFASTGATVGDNLRCEEDLGDSL